MINLGTDIHSLTEFKRRTAEFVRAMKKTGRALVLTVNGKSDLVVQDAVAYQKLLDELERAQAMAGIRAGLDAFAQGRGASAPQALEDLRHKYDIPR